MRLLSGCLAVLIATVVLFPVASRASCGSASCPIETLGVESREKGWLRLGYEFEYIDQDQPRIGTHDADVGEIRGHHDEVYTVNRTHRLTASYAFTDRLSADAILPFISRSHSHIHHHGGDDIPETWNFDGLGDASLMGRYVFLKPESASRPSLGILTGVELPTGKHEVKNEDGDLAEPGITPGSGSTDWIMGLTSNQSLPGRTLAGEYATLPLFFTVTYKANGRGEDNYRLGDVFTANAGTIYPVTRRLGAIGQVNLKVNGRDSRGNTYEETEKTGGEYVYISPGFSFEWFENISLWAILQVPVYQRVNQIQLTSDYNVLLGLSYRLRKGA